VRILIKTLKILQKNIEQNAKTNKQLTIND